MKIYECIHCSKVFKRSDYLKKHYDRKYPCTLKNNPKIRPKKGQNKAEIRPKKGQNKAEKGPQNCQKKIGCFDLKNDRENDIKNDNKNENENENENETKEKKYNCQYCNKGYKLKDSLYKHINQLRCTKIPKKDKNRIILRKKNKILIKKVEQEKSLIQMSHCNINSNNTINNTNNSNNKIINNNLHIKINPFGKENTEFLTRKEKMKIINKCYMGVPALIKTIHDRPENRNFFIKNINSKVMAYLDENNEVVYNDYNSICDELIQNNISRIDEYFEELNSDIKINTKSRLIKMLEKSNSGELTDKYIEDIKYYLLNISKKNKKDLNDFIDKLELEIIGKN